MKTYHEDCYLAGNFVDVPVNVPTPKELQAQTQNDYVSVVISNFSDYRGDHYCVAKFEKETNDVMIKMGFLFKTVATGYVYDFRGTKARLAVIDKARDLLVG